MKISWREAKRAFYILLTFFGAALLLLAVRLSFSSHVVELFTALILFLTGGGLVFFGVEVYLLQEDWEIWS